MKKLWILLALGVALCTACSEDDTTDPSPVASEIGISGFDPTEVVALEGGAVEVTVKSNATWRLTGKKTWCRPSAVEGKNGEKVTFTVDPNDTGDSRMIVYKFFCGDKTVPFIVTQAPAKIFGIDSNPEFEVASVGGNVIVKLSSNIAYTFKVEDDGKEWITAPQTRGVTTERITFRVQANSDYIPRTGHITFTANEKDYMVTVNQKQVDKLSVDKTTFDMQPEGGPIAIKVTTNVEYTVTIDSKVEWIHYNAAPASLQAMRSLTDYTETFTVDAAIATRSGKITFKSADGALVQTVTVNQEGPSRVFAEFPDASFRAYLRAGAYGYIINSPTTATNCEVTEKGLTVKVLDFGRTARGITNVTGIHALASVTQILCKNNPLVKIPLADLNVQSLDLDNGLSSNKCGVNVVVSGTKLESLNFANNTKTVTLDVSECPSLKSLNVGSCSVLTTVYLKTGQTVDVYGSGSYKVEYK